MTSLEELTGRWHQGWTLSRGLAVDPVVGSRVEGSRRTAPGAESGREVEYVVLGADEHTSRLHLAARAASRERDAWVTVVTTDPRGVATRLAEHDLRTSYDVEWLMSVSLDDQSRVELPEGYRSAITRQDPDVVALQLLGSAGGEPAASGQVALVGDWCVPDRIATEPGHRRRGLGAALMTRLAEHAGAAGAGHGVLVASREGRALYESLGWTAVADVVVGRQR